MLKDSTTKINALTLVHLNSSKLEVIKWFFANFCYLYAQITIILKNNKTNVLRSEF